MAVKPFSASLGRKVFRGGRRAMTSERDFAQSIRAQMGAIEQSYAAWIGNIDDQGAEILLEALRPTFDKSQILVPVDTGALKESGYLEARQQRGHSQVEIGYGRAGQPEYTVFVHENLDVAHQPPTQAKFLQDPLEEDEPDIQERLIEGIRIAAGFSNG